MEEVELVALRQQAVGLGPTNLTPCVCGLHLVEDLYMLTLSCSSLLQASHDLRTPRIVLPPDETILVAEDLGDLETFGHVGVVWAVPLPVPGPRVPVGAVQKALELRDLQPVYRNQLGESVGVVTPVRRELHVARLLMPGMQRLLVLAALALGQEETCL